MWEIERKASAPARVILSDKSRGKAVAHAVLEGLRLGLALGRAQVHGDAEH
jgi:hypothetical protein